MITKEEAARELLSRKAASRSLYEFLKQAWFYIEGADNFKDSWHIGAICEHLEAVKNGEIKRLLINVPPRTCKTNTISVAFPAWWWATEPQIRFLFASYGQDVSMDSSVKCRTLIESDWYQARWGHKFVLRSDQNTKTRFDNDKKGYRIATSVGGAMTGFGGDVIIGDDLNSTSDTSEALLKSTNGWYTGTLSTRLNDLQTGRIINVQQRTSEEDISGNIIRHDSDDLWVKLILPMEYEPDRKCYTVPLPSTNGKPWCDPRKKNKELLWPNHIGPKELDLLKASFNYNQYLIAGQLQQRPAPAEGGIFKKSWFKLWGANRPLPDFQYIIQSYDTAVTADTQNDPTVGETWGIFKEEGRWCALMLDCWTAYLEYPQLKKRVVEAFHSLYGDPPKEVDLIVIEDKSSGASLRRDLAQDGLPIKAFKTGKADKVQRAHMVTHLAENGLIYVLESNKPERKGMPVSWAEAFLDEITMFPNAKHDDLVDAAVQCWSLLKDMKLIAASAGSNIDEDESEYKESWEMEGVNPYAV